MLYYLSFKMSFIKPYVEFHFILKYNKFHCIDQQNAIF